MRALVALVLLASALPFAAADHDGCEQDSWVGPAHVECGSSAHHDGRMYEKRAEVDTEESDLQMPVDHPDVHAGFEHKYTTAGSNASTCRVYVYMPVMTTRGTPCAGAHHELLP